MNKELISIIEFILYGSLIYFGELLMYKSLFHLFIINAWIMPYILPIITTTLFISPVSLIQKYLYQYYCSAYFISGVIHSLLLDMFLCSIIYQFVIFFISIPFWIGFSVLLILPLIITIYGVLNAFTIRSTRLKLKWAGYNSKTTIAHLSDLHLGAVFQRKSIEDVVRNIQRESPDIVVITGDLADGSTKIQGKWLEPFNELKMPILFISGNHEEIANKDSVLSEIAETNIKYIGGKSYLFKGMHFIGVDYEEDIKKRLIEVKESSKTNSNMPNVLLYHVPELYPRDLAEYNVFLHLAGHTHGGQSLPIHFPTWMLNACFSGLYPDKTNKHFVFVTNGIGTALTPLRTFSKSEIAYITIEG